jgi:bacterioferritin-associated ferredoxin
MFVCQCRGVTDRQVRGAVAEGCTTLRSVAAATGAGTGCGGCIPTIKDLVCTSCPSRMVALACDDTVLADDGMLVGDVVGEAFADRRLSRAPLVRLAVAE